MVNAIDCSVKLDGNNVTSLRAVGVTHIGRYLGQWNKSISNDEKQTILNAGLKIFSIYESDPTYAGYFNYSQGKEDAIKATGYANDLGQPEGSAIYFTVDYDMQSSDFGSLIDYLNGVKDNIGKYEIGLYGPFAVLLYLGGKGLVRYFWQTYAWSYGNRIDFGHIFQFQNEKSLAGVDVDFNNLEQDDVGAWGNANEVQQPQPQPNNNGFLPIGQIVTVKSTATNYATGERIADFVRGGKYQVIARRESFKSFSKREYLLNDIMSWVLEQDIVESGVRNGYEGNEIVVGSKVIVQDYATHYETGEPIASFVKGQKYNVLQIRNASRGNSKKAYLLDDIESWVLEQDVRKA